MSHAEPGEKPKVPILVAAAVLVENGKVLLTQRKKGSHLAGAWEFPGGKVEPGEDPRAALRRELVEEIGVDAEIGAPVEVTFHAYPEKDVLLLFFVASRRAGSPEPRALDVAALRWVSAAELREDELPPADVAVVGRVRALLG
jgi:8-oxo-dGTP diphosphatase